MSKTQILSQIAANQNCSVEQILEAVASLCEAVNTWGELQDTINLQETAKVWGISVPTLWSLNRLWR